MPTNFAFNPKVRKKAKPLLGLAAAKPKVALKVQRKGGLAVSRDREHMAKIGRKGGKAKRG